MKELIFSINNIFDISRNDCALNQYECSHYHIPAYQRGYKWSSDKNGAVSILLDDLYNAFSSTEKNLKEYFLQYITVKPVKVDAIEEKKYLEVIDGQQRLTTLSILISVFYAKTDLLKDNISCNKLDYAIRENFFNEHIYDKKNLNSLLQYDTWNELIDKREELNKQDIYYIYMAAKKCAEFCDKLTEEQKIDEFYHYLLNNIKLIVNSVEPHIISETVFKNLNSNKVPLTEVELIKGLLITRLGRNNHNLSKKSFKEILEKRIYLGRYWDEVSRWANQPQINTFYFDGNEGMFQLLVLTALCLDPKNKESDFPKDNKDFPLFNFFYKFNNYELIYNKLKGIHEQLNDWYIDDKFYNLIGFCRFVKNSDLKKINFLRICFSKKNKIELSDYLNKEINNKLKLPNNKLINDLKYGEDDKLIHAVLLLINVFPEGLKKRFQFHDFIENNWSLEHIFPQSPEGKNYTLNKEQRDLVKEMLEDYPDEKIKQVLEKDQRTEEEKVLYYEALQKLPELNSIGNMCLLTGGDNSSNGCMFFREKRNNILKLIQKGSFVPKHTFDVFSKMINTLGSNDLCKWSKSDIKNHSEYISEFVSKIIGEKK